MLHPAIEHAASLLGVEDDILGLREAAEYSTRTIAAATQHLQERVNPDGIAVDVTVFGSYARQEASLTSDFDYLIIPHGVPEMGQIKVTRDLLRSVDDFIAKIPGGQDDDGSDRRPGATGLFGRIHSAPDLVEKIGLEQDTNATHTRRCLLLQESCSIYRPDLHKSLLSSVLARYLADYQTPKLGPPRFLINDLNRYWFTVAVDYQAKRWERLERGWGIRYLKLLISRRLSYLAAVLPLLLCSENEPAEPHRLLEAYQTPPLARLAGLVTRDGFEEHDELATVLKAASTFTQQLGNDEVRPDLEKVSGRPRAGDVPVFDELKMLTKAVDDALRKICFGSLLRSKTERYLVL
jgi:predicted nucleotidyltransferase